jgi:type III pantothenate kinase
LILQMDVGNTRTKWRLCHGHESIESGVMDRDSTKLLPALTQRPAELWISSVAGAEFETRSREEAHKRWNIEPWFARSSASACGLVNSYQEPQRMGVDRWLAMIAAWSRIDETGDAGVCVVDAGSALTIDFVAAAGEHLGGYILPGLDSMEKALLQDTDRVRFSDAPRDSIAPGRSTEQAVYNGLLLSQAGAVALALSKQAGQFSLLFSGGNGPVLQEVLAMGGSFAADLVLDGLALLAASSSKERAVEA